MKYSEAKQGRIFVIRLEDGEIVHEVIEAFAGEHAIRAAALIILGGSDEGSRLVVGPENGRCSPPVIPLEKVIDDVREVTGTGTIFPDDEGNPILHLHMALRQKFFDYNRVHSPGCQGMARHGSDSL